MSQPQEYDEDDESVRHEISSDRDGTTDDDAWDDVEESLRLIFDAWNGSPLCGPEQMLYIIIRDYLGRL